MNNDYEEEDWDRPKPYDPLDEFDTSAMDEFDANYSEDQVPGQVKGKQWPWFANGVFDFPPAPPKQGEDKPWGPGTAFGRLLGRTTTDDETLRLLKIKEDLQLADDDAVWLIFIGMQYHFHLYDCIPREIKNLKTENLHTIERTAKEFHNLHIKIQQDRLELINRRLEGEFIKKMDKKIINAMASLTKHIDQQFKKKIAAIPQPRFDMRSYLWICMSGICLLLAGVFIGRII